MNEQILKVHDQVVIESRSLQQIFDALKDRNYQILGPTLKDEAIVYDALNSIADLPIGWTDEQNGGTYRLKKRQDKAMFGYAVGPHSWKKFLHPPNIRLWEAQRGESGFEVQEKHHESPKFAFIGVRSCELHAIAIQDKVFMGGPFTDPIYKSRRENIFVVAINCAQAGGTCFCVSMNTGPKATFGYDLALTEILDTNRHDFLIEIGSERGAQLLREVPIREAGPEDKSTADQILEGTKQQMGRTMDTTNIKSLLYKNYEHPRWDEVANRCLSCANCTMVCPTCFCTTVEDVTDLKGDHAERWRKWDSCFTTDFSYIHGGSVRSSVKSRYRQWMTHKLATWIDQFGTSGCVGCGRCITWCPVAIDITEELRAIRTSESSDKKTHPEKEKQDENA